LAPGCRPARLDPPSETRRECVFFLYAHYTSEGHPTAERMEHEHLIDPDLIDHDASAQAVHNQIEAPVDSMVTSTLGENGQDDAMQPGERPEKPLISSKHHGTRLYHSGYVLVLVLLYAALALFAWIVTCTLAFHPITSTSNYGLPSLHLFERVPADKSGA
jgi:hypothetical protein